MPAHFEMDVTEVVAWAEDLAGRHGVPGAARIIDCARPHYAGVSCVCGWLDDPPMPTPGVVTAP